MRDTQQTKKFESQEKLVINNPNPPSTRRRIASLECRPPPDAPLEPLAMRRRHSSNPTPKTEYNNDAPESLLWSHSKTWTSGEKKEQMTFQKTRQNLHYMGADKSPFVPQNAVEYAALKLRIAEEKSLQLSAKVDNLVARRVSKSDDTSDDKQNRAITITLLGGKNIKDGLTAVLAQHNCFNTELHGKKPIANGTVWPTIVQLKEEGDARAKGNRRRLPLPQSLNKGFGDSHQYRAVDANLLDCSQLRSTSYDIVPFDEVVSERLESGLLGDVEEQQELPEYLVSVMGHLNLGHGH